MFLPKPVLAKSMSKNDFSISGVKSFLIASAYEEATFAAVWLVGIGTMSIFGLNPASKAVADCLHASAAFEATSPVSSPKVILMISSVAMARYHLFQRGFF